jgi:type II secretory pathway predicted ATPase ExeA
MVPLSQTLKKEISASRVPGTDEVRMMARDYMKRTNLNYRSFGLRIGYSESAVHKFTCGHYIEIGRNDAAIRYHAWKYMLANPPGQKDVCPMEKLYDTQDALMLRETFYACLQKRCAAKIEGDPGMGKSDIARYLIWEFNQKHKPSEARALYVYCPHAVTPRTLLQLIAEAAGSIVTGPIRTVIGNLKFELQGKKVLIVIDEAQHLNIESMEAVRELLDLPPHCGLLFLGSHKFGIDLYQKSVVMDLEQWHRRFQIEKQMSGISEHEAREIVRAELGEGWSKQLIDSLVKDSRAKAGYISGGRLFGALRDLKADLAPKKKAVGA